MKSNRKRENKMYFINETEYIYLPFSASSKATIYYTIEAIKKQVRSCSQWETL